VPACQAPSAATKRPSYLATELSRYRLSRSRWTRVRSWTMYAGDGRAIFVTIIVADTGDSFV
jgi:hypothetical protein